MKKILLSLALSIISVVGLAQTGHPTHEWRLGWGDPMFETAVFYDNAEQYGHAYTGHIFGEYQYNLKRWLGLGFECDFENVDWQTLNRQTNNVGKDNFYNIGLMPTVRFTYFRKGIVSMYSGVGVGLNINGGSEKDYLGRYTVCAPLLNLTAYAVSVNWLPNWFATFEIGGLFALNGKQEVFMLGSRLFSISIGYRL